ncbi:MAG: ISAs1 family transposase [Anaerolineae bacterium]|nr:ISAs1 family transposase [Anaerolineae bacterium]
MEQAKVLSQVEVGRKENEITKASKALHPVEISHKVVTADAIHTQRALATQIVAQGGDYVLPVKENHCTYTNTFSNSLPLNIRSLVLGKIQTDFLTAQKVNKGHGRLETRTMTTSESSPLFDGSGASLPFGTSIPMVAFWTLLPYFP